jgi:periplasmic protein TonB
MTRRSNGLLLSAAAVSVAVHLLLLLLVPWRPMQPRRVSREVVPVRLVHVAPPVRQPLPPKRVVEQSLPERVTVAPEPLVQPTQQEVRLASEPAAEVTTAQQEVSSVESPPEAAGSPASTAEARSPAAPVAVQPSAEIAAYQAILSALRGRALREIRYPPLARANGWKGTVIVALRLDGVGKLQQAIVRQSSGYEVLDRAATRLVERITPVANPLGIPLSIEVPITYELK